MDKTNQKDREPLDQKPRKRVILLEDLDGEDDMVGGAGQKLVFGESAGPPAGFPPLAIGGSGGGKPNP